RRRSCRLSRKGLRLRHPESDSAGNPRAVEGTDRDAACWAEGDHLVPQLRTLERAGRDALQWTGPKDRPVPLRLVRLTQHPLPLDQRFRGSLPQEQLSDRAPLLPFGLEEGYNTAEPLGSDRRLPRWLITGSRSRGSRFRYL